jgi:hypothetical protein
MNEEVFTNVGEQFVGDLLVHHGVKGQHWGVRNQEGSSTETRGQRRQSKRQLNTYLFNSIRAEPIFHTMSKSDYNKLTTTGETFAKNTTLKRISMGPQQQRDGAIYVSRLLEDSNFYKASFPVRGPLSDKTGGGKKIYKQPSYEITYKTVKKLSSPSEKERVDSFIALLDTPSVKIAGKSAPISGRQYLENNGFNPRFKKYDTQELGLKEWYKFVHQQGNQNNPLGQAYFNSLRAKGYNALPDDQDRQVLTKAPLILLDPLSTVKTSSVQKLSANDINQAQRQLGKRREPISMMP